MKKRIFLVILFLVVFVAAAIFLLSPNEKKQIKKDIMALKNAVENKRFNDALQYVSRDYSDGYHSDFESFSSSVQQLVDNFDSIKIVITGLQINIDSVSSSKIIFAACSMGLKVYARYENEKTLIFGGVIKPSSVKAYFKKADHNYQVYRAQY